MSKGICHIAQIPLRGEPRSSAEMVTQLLFGETYQVIDQQEDWYKISMDYDGYEGWISSSSLFLQDTNREVALQKIVHSIQPNDLIEGRVHTSMGSELLSVGLDATRLHVGELARTFLGTPYLWGGRHFSGIDCSGFVQVVYKVMGLPLPRDASQQQKMGKPVRYENLFEGDLVFFEKNERVQHVGIALSKDKIIHSHGFVRIDKLTKKGIYNSITGVQTHEYHSAKRLR